ncbi:toll/interleukin-1 receptor domain-containing protein [Lentzea roselyniae]|uniref:toll/interleukin-1 receptor domain-containing protein n=1 Tax=Lentzea roselyniae TaxID=531940 RepID=UPI0031F91ABC
MTELEAEPGTPLAHAIRAARAAARRGDVHGVDHAYTAAVRISRIIAHEHCATLLSLGAIGKAAQRCDEYLTADDTGLRVLRAQIRSAATDHAKATQDVRELRKRDLTELQRAVLARVAALAAADRYDLPTAESELNAAERHFRRAGRTEHLEAIGNDRLLLDVRRASHAPRLDDPAPRTPAELLQRAAALRRDLRYEEALAQMTRCVTSYEIEPALRPAVLHELTVLLVMTRQAGAARRLFPLLVAARGPEVLSQLPDATQTLSPDRRLDQVRRLIAENELTAAESLLGEGNSPLWHLTAGELAYARGRLDQAARHFRQASARTDHTELKALALRKLGDTCADAGDEEQALQCWNEAHHADGRVLAAIRRVHRDGEKALAGLVVAVEAARGADPPRSTDVEAARRWLRKTTRKLPRDQVVWMMHATQDQLHHVIVGRKITHIATDVHISELTRTVHQLRAWNPGHDPAIIGSLLTELTVLIALEEVLDALPPKVTRIAVVTSDVLAGIPLADLPVPGNHLGRTHTLSHLPCLSALTGGDAGFPAKAGPLRRRLRKNGEPVPLETRPKVFLSFANKDRPHAEQLRDELEARNVNAWLDESGTVPDALATSDYHVLLWSANTALREQVTEEWAAAFNRELTRRRAFLFIVRLDEEPLSPLLAPRKHIDLVEAADRLVTTWRADRKSELPVFPQPVPPAPGGPTVAISVRSHDLGVTHVVMTPLHLTGAELHRTVFRALRLPTEQATFDATVGMRFSYELFSQNKPIPADESTVELMSDLVDISVHVESIAPRRPYCNREYRPDDDLDKGFDVDQQRMLLVAAFRHLLP